MPSTVIKSFSYDPSSQRLRVVYQSGITYDYKKVPPEKFTEMKAAYSKGTYLNQHIKNHYDFEKLS